MKAMILAAGSGTRLRPLTDNRPKALVEVAGRTLLEIALSRLRAFGIRDVMINVHHFAGMILGYLEANANFGMRIEVSQEEILLDTGGGLKKAAAFFTDGAAESFILHNVDVLSTIDLGRMVKFHSEHAALATLAVQERQTSRYLLFDANGELCGRRSSFSAADQKTEMVRKALAVQPLAFCGIHIISPRLFGLMIEENVFSIITAYLRLAGQAERIIAFRADEYYWLDVGRPAGVEQACRDFS